MKASMKNTFLRMGMSEALAQDFDWLVTCAKINASLGYPVGELFKSNSTARDLMEISSCRMEKMITLAGRIGRFICAGESDSVRECTRLFHEEARLKGYALS